MLRRFALQRVVAAFSLALTLSGCVTGAALRDARRAEERQDYDLAVVEYGRAVQRDPDNVNARSGLQRARLRASQDHFTRARRHVASRRLDEAVMEYTLAAELNPDNRVIADELDQTQNQLRARVVINRDGKTELEALVERMRDQRLPGLDVAAEPLPDELTFRDASNQVIIRALAQLAKVNVVFDPAFRPTPISIEIRNQSFAEALQSITASTQTFYRVTAPRTITIIPDTPAKRREYEEDIVRTFYLSNADLKETMDLLRIVIDARRIGGMQGTNTITITDTAERVEAAGRLISMIDKARPEVLIDVELLEVNRTRLAQYGLQFASPGSSGISGSADVNKTGMTLKDLTNLAGSQILLTNLPALYYRLIKEDSSARVLANPQLRAQVGTTAQAQFGEEVPVPVTTFSPIAAGGVAQQPITSYNYRNIGVNIDITPRTHMNNDVTLALSIEVTSLGTAGFGGLPTFGNRQIKTIIRLKDGETNMLAGLIRDDERKERNGIPGFSDLPGVGRFFGNSRDERVQTDIILMLTPHIVRVLELTEEDVRAFKMGRDLGTAGSAGGGRGVGAPPSVIDLPLPDESQIQGRPDIQPGTAQPPPGGPARPVMPPPPVPQPPPNRGQTPPR
ncbi:MAG: secretin N-terminal domain-containing protein [Vicinamibacterales bacterium]